MNKECQERISYGCNEFLDRRDGLENNPDNWTESCKTRVYTPIDIGKKWEVQTPDGKAGFEIVLEPIKAAANIVPPKWDELYWVIETKTEYVFYYWGTTA